MFSSHQESILFRSIERSKPTPKTSTPKTSIKKST